MVNRGAGSKPSCYMNYLNLERSFVLSIHVEAYSCQRSRFKLFGGVMPQNSADLVTGNEQ